MAQTRRQSVSGELRRLAEHLQAYRNQVPRRRRLPEAIWDAAVELAGQHGVNPVASTLGLDYYALKRRVLAGRATAGQRGQRGGRDKASAPEFVEVCVGTPTPSVGWTLEFQDGAGRRLTVRVPEGRDMDVAALAKAFWRRSG